MADEEKKKDEEQPQDELGKLEKEELIELLRTLKEREAEAKKQEAEAKKNAEAEKDKRRKIMDDFLDGKHENKGSTKDEDEDDEDDEDKYYKNFLDKMKRR